MDFKGKRILIISPHPDDETIAAGGFIARAKTEGAMVFVLFLVTGSEEQYGSNSEIGKRIEEMKCAMDFFKVDKYELLYTENHLRLDILPRKELVDLIERKAELSLQNITPDILIFPGNSYNQDHNAVSSACVTATRPYPKALKHSPDLILTYSHFDEQFWNTDSFPNQINNFWIDISQYMDTKEKAVDCYKSQIKQGTLHWRTKHNILEINRLIGLKIGVAAAEEFCCMRFCA
jgi:N-acetylglucosamine malate deacetylase 1